MENDGEPRVEQSKNSSDEDMIKVNEIKLSPHRYNEKADKNSFVTNFNEISAINNTTVGPDTSLNTSQLELIRKLHEKAVGSAQKPDNYDTQSNASYFFNEEELANHEEHIQQKINEIWNETQQQVDNLQNDF